MARIDESFPLSPEAHTSMKYFVIRKKKIIIAKETRLFFQLYS